MLFNSIEFLIFFPVVTTLFFLLPHKFRWSLLLTASCFFYMFFKPEYILILAFTIVIDYFAGIMLENEQSKRKKKIFLIVSLVANIGVLAVFKYYNFLNDNLTGLLTVFGYDNPVPYLKILLPIGLSFHTFQAMSYTIEVYRGNQKAERHFGIYSLYVMFYPQLVAGPIERPQNILHQFHEKKYFTYDNAVIGLNLIAYGLFKKIVIADRLAVYVNRVYGDVENASSWSVLAAVVFFSFQIYCDFSGYSDIARGTAKFMGYDLMVNFNRPYLAQSVSEFWTRWHISLSTWFRDYLYIPLGGNRVSKAAWYRNIMIVFLVSGLWHGANWTFIIWGALHGLFILGAGFTSKWRNAVADGIGLTKVPFLNRILNQLTVFALVSFAWIYFRAENFSHANAIISKIFNFNLSFNIIQFTAGTGPLNMFLSFLLILVLFLTYYIPKTLELKKSLSFLMVTFFFIIILGKDVAAEFIYFQF